jgi:hypothetical protein
MLWPCVKAMRMCCGVGTVGDGAAGLAQRARIVLLAAEGLPDSEIADRVGVTRQTVVSRRARSAQRGLAGLDDAPRSGRPHRIHHGRIITETLKPPPKKLGVTHWSSRQPGRRRCAGDGRPTGRRGCRQSPV